MDLEDDKIQAHSWYSAGETEYNHEEKIIGNTA